MASCRKLQSTMSSPWSTPCTSSARDKSMPCPIPTTLYYLSPSAALAV
jgi:hypothetical protein